jgi:hypothetical protein
VNARAVAPSQRPPLELMMLLKTVAGLVLLTLCACDDSGGALDASAPMDAAVVDGHVADADLRALATLVYCDPDVPDAPTRSVFRFPDPVSMTLVGVDGRLPDLRIEWALTRRPDGSQLALASTDQLAVEVAPDVPGQYEVCYDATGEGAQYTGCCPINMIEGFEGEFISAPVVDPSWLRIAGGISMRWQTNQFTQPVSARLDLQAPAAWGDVDVEGYTSLRGEERFAGVRLTFDPYTAEPGHLVEVQLPARALVTQEAVTLSGRVEIVSPDQTPYTSPTPDTIILQANDDGWYVLVQFDPEVAQTLQTDAIIVLVEGIDGPIWVSAEAFGDGLYGDEIPHEDGLPVAGETLATVFVEPTLDNLVDAARFPSWWSRPMVVRKTGGAP